MSLRSPYANNEQLEKVYAGTEVIKEGSNGSGVCLLQQGLLQWDPSCLPVYGADGDWGNESIEACRKFQDSYNLTVDGKVGKQTLTILSENFSGFTPQPQRTSDVQIRRLSIYERQLDSVGLAGAQFNTKVTSKNGVVIRVTSMGTDDPSDTDPEKSYGWVSNGKLKFKPTSPDLEICALTADVESGNGSLNSGTYDTINAYDTAGLSIGLFHDTFHTGNAQKILEKFRYNNPDSFNFFFKNLISDIVSMNGNRVAIGCDGSVIDLKMFRNLSYAMAVVDASYSSAMQQAMEWRTLQWLGTPEATTGENIRRDTARPYKFTSRRGDAVILSLSVNMGEGGCRKYVKAVEMYDADEKTRIMRLRDLVINGDEDLGLPAMPGKEARIDHVLENTKGPEWD